MKILLTGGDGYVAKALYSGLKDQYEITSINRLKLDLTDSLETVKYFSDKYYDVIIHTAVVGGNRLKSQNTDVMDQNLQMYYNLLRCKNKFNKFIYFGSGAEIFFQNTPYGLSKHIIRQSIINKNNFYNLRIFAVFDENELDTRFIKANIKKYINKIPIEIHENKLMDFFYIKDLITLVNYYILNNNLQKEVNCTYKETFTLEKIAQLINNLNEYKVPIIKQNQSNSKNYCGNFENNIQLSYIGLEKGINEVYNKLKKNGEKIHH